MIFSQPETYLGTIKVRTCELIEACDFRINSILETRQKYKDGSHKAWLEKATFWHNTIWWMFGFTKPTIEDAKKGYCIESDMWHAMIYGHQLEVCKDLKRAATATTEEYMFISVEAARFCGMRRR